MGNKTKVSVIMSVYNTDFNIVKRSIDSVLNQDYQNFELIIVDDGSNNSSQYELVEYVKTHQDKISYLWHYNRGQSISINKAIALAIGNYVTIIDADDEYQSNHLSSCLRELSVFDLIASTTNTIVDDEEDYYVPCKNNANELIHVDDCILFATLFGKKEVFSNVAFQDMYSADSHFFDQASKIYIVNKVDLRTYTYYRNNQNSLCSKLKKEKN